MESYGYGAICGCSLSIINGIRISLENEKEGLDMLGNGTPSYPYFQIIQH